MNAAATATVPAVSLEVIASDGAVTGERQRHEEREAGAQPPRIDADGVLAGSVDAVEELLHLFHPHQPKRAGGHDEPEAVDHRGAEDEQRREREGVAPTELTMQLHDGHDEHGGAHEYVDGLPDLHLPNADEHLRVGAAW